jgi:hypothetical protein
MHFAMTTEEKKIEIIGKIVNLENEKLIDRVDELLKGEFVDRHAHSTLALFS